MLIDITTYKNKEDIPYKEKDIIHVREQVSGGVEDYVRVWEIKPRKFNDGYIVLLPWSTGFAAPTCIKSKVIPNLIIDVIDTNLVRDLEEQEQQCLNTLKVLRELRKNKKLLNIIKKAKDEI